MSEVYLVSHLRGKKHQLALEDVQKGKKTDDNVRILLHCSIFIETLPRMSTDRARVLSKTL